MLMKKLRDTALATAAAGALMVGMGVGSASAASVESVFVSGINVWNDRSGEIVLDSDLKQKAFGDPITVGDFIVGVMDIDTILPANVATNLLNELTGYFISEVASISNITNVAASGSNSCPVAGCTVADFVFQAAGQTAWETLLGLGVGATLPNTTNFDDVMVLFFEDPLQDMTFTSMPGAFAGATNGTLMAALGLTDASTSWEALAAPIDPDEIALLANLPTKSTGDIQIGLNVLYEGFGGSFARELPGYKGSKVDFVGVGDLRGPLAGDAFPIRDVTDIAFFYVPEPGTVGMMGLGLLALGALSRRRRKIAA